MYTTRGWQLPRLSLQNRDGLSLLLDIIDMGQEFIFARIFVQENGNLEVSPS